MHSCKSFLFIHTIQEGKFLQNSDHFLFQPFAADKADNKAEGAEHPVEVHSHPDAQQLAVEAEDHQVAEAHPEHPHRDDAHRHGEGCVAGGAEDVG